MNIQIFGKGKCFDTKKAERYFKERRIPYQYVDLLRYGLSGKEFDSVLRGIGGIDNLIDWDSKSPEVTLMRYMEDKMAKEDKVFDNLAYVMAELNIIHPFREGNGRSIREFIRLMAKRMGYDLNWGNVDKEELLEASILSVDNYKVLIRVLEACVD